VVAKAIIFRAMERIVSDQPWYQGGYRANIVAYAIAKIAHDVTKLGRAVDFQIIWQRQAPTDALEAALVVAAEAVHGVLIDPPEGLRNVTEWAKKQACWERSRGLGVALPQSFLNSLISSEERREVQRSGRRDQRQLDGIQAQIAVVNAGSAFWTDVLDWGRKRGLLTPTEVGILRATASRKGSVPSERQSSKMIDVLNKLQAAGYTEELPADS